MKDWEYQFSLSQRVNKLESSLNGEQEKIEQINFKENSIKVASKEMK